MPQVNYNAKYSRQLLDLEDSTYCKKLKLAKEFIERYLMITQEEKNDPVIIDLFIQNSKEFNKLKKVNFIREGDLESIF